MAKKDNGYNEESIKILEGFATLQAAKDEIDQTNLLGKKIKGKIEVELYGPGKKALVRKPSDELDSSTCITTNNQ